MFSPNYYRNLPTIASGHFDDTVVDDGKRRVLVSRMTIADGAPEDRQVFVLLDGRTWESDGDKWRDQGTGDPMCSQCDGLGWVDRFQAYGCNHGFQSEACDGCGASGTVDADTGLRRDCDALTEHRGWF